MRIERIDGDVVILSASLGELTDLRLEGRIVEGTRPWVPTPKVQALPDVRCTWCGARVGEDCRMPSGRVVPRGHVERRAAFLLARDQLIFGG